MIILITGGSGFIGTQLTKLLMANGYEVNWLTRKINSSVDIPQYLWNWEKKKIETSAIEKADAIINLAGANVGARRWNAKWKKEIYDSRIRSTEFLFEMVSQHPGKLKAFISASATGYYGCVTSEKIYNESDSPGTDFLANTCNDWETAANKFAEAGIRTVIIRTGVVMSDKSEAYKKICLPIRYGVGASIGSGNQFFSWIHLDDLCNIYLKAICDERLRGVFNAVAPEYITNSQLTKALAKHFNKPVWLPNIPSTVIKILFGEIANSLLKGSRISSEKLMRAGFEFKYPGIDQLMK
jgi:uncharacterized protein (TIGR01777 family)